MPASFIPALKDHERFLSRSQDMELQLSSKEKELEQLFQKQRRVSERLLKWFPPSCTSAFNVHKNFTPTNSQLSQTEIQLQEQQYVIHNRQYRQLSIKYDKTYLISHIICQDRTELHSSANFLLFTFIKYNVINTSSAAGTAACVDRYCEISICPVSPPFRLALITAKSWNETRWLFFSSQLLRTLN